MRDPMTAAEHRNRQEAWERMLALLPALKAMSEIIDAYVTYSRDGRQPVFHARTKNVWDPKALGGWRYKPHNCKKHGFVYISMSEAEALKRLRDSAPVEGGV